MPVTRGTWAQHALDAYRPLFQHLAGTLGAASAAATDPEEDEPGRETGSRTMPGSGLTTGRRRLEQRHARVSSALVIAAVSWVSCSAYSP